MTSLRVDEAPWLAEAISRVGAVFRELIMTIAPVVLGGGKRLFEGFSSSLDLEHLGVRQSRYATFVDYRMKRP